LLSAYAITLLLTFKLAAVTTALLLIAGVPLARLLASMRSPLKPVFETLIAMPMVLPPSVIGFYLLVAFSPQSGLGKFLESAANLRLIFSFEGLVVASFIYSLPFLVRPIQAGFEALPPSLSEASFTLGKSRMRTFFSVLLPNVTPAILSGGVLAFAHTIGEFGIVLMIGGNIPGKTRVASIAVYDEVEALHYGNANDYALTLLVISFVILLAVSIVNRRRTRLA